MHHGTSCSASAASKMRLCQPHLRALGRSLLAASLLSGAMAALWLVAAAAGARLTGLHLDHQDHTADVPLMAVIAIAMGGASLVQLARNTLLNRRTSWIDHSLSEFVLAHELWRACDRRQLDRSLGAVAAIARFAGSPAALALVETPWAMLVLGGLWMVNIDLAAIASGSALVLLLLALTGSRITQLARQFDTGYSAHNSGHDCIRAGGLEPDASLEQACDVANRWEITQRALVAWTYAGAQARARRQLAARLIVMSSACAIGWIAAVEHEHGKLGLDELMCTVTAAVLAQVVLLRATVDADRTGHARAALRHLAKLYIPRTRYGDTRLPALARPDLRAPIAAAWLAAAASLVGLASVATYWNLPVFDIAHGLFASPQNLTANNPPVPFAGAASILPPYRKDLSC